MTIKKIIRLLFVLAFIAQIAPIYAVFGLTGQRIKDAIKNGMKTVQKSNLPETLKNTQETLTKTAQNKNITNLKKNASNSLKNAQKKINTLAEQSATFYKNNSKSITSATKYLIKTSTSNIANQWKFFLRRTATIAGLMIGGGFLILFGPSAYRLRCKMQASSENRVE